MKTKLYTLITLLSLSAAMLRAQSLNWTVEHDDPFDIKNFSASIDPLFIDMNGHNSYSFGWGLRGEYMMGKRILANVDMRTGFGTNLYRKSNENTRNYYTLEGGLGFAFVNRMKVKNVPIILSQTTSGNTRTTYYIRGGVPAKCRLIVAVRGGFSQYTNSLNYEKLPDSLLTFGGTTYKEAKEKGIFRDTTAGGTDIPQVGGIALTTIYGGIQFRSIRNLLIDVEGWGMRGNITYSDFFVDVLFAPVIGLKDFQSNGERFDVKYKDLSHFGWRIGWFMRKPKEQGFSFKLEAGSRPGFKAPENTSIPVNPRNLYCMVTFGLYIPLKIKPMYEGD